MLYALPRQLGVRGMADDKVSVTFTCSKCGPTVLELPDDHTDDSIAKCKICGAEFGRFGDIKAKAVETVKAEVVGQFKDAFKGLKGWTVK